MIKLRLAKSILGPHANPGRVAIQDEFIFLGRQWRIQQCRLCVEKEAVELKVVTEMDGPENSWSSEFLDLKFTSQDFTTPIDRLESASWRLGSVIHFHWPPRNGG